MSKARKCKHPDADLGYMVWHIQAEVRHKMGERQSKCRKCGDLVWPCEWSEKHEEKYKRIDAAKDRRR